MLEKKPMSTFTIYYSNSTHYHIVTPKERVKFVNLPTTIYYIFCSFICLWPQSNIAKTYKNIVALMIIQTLNLSNFSEEDITNCTYSIFYCPNWMSTMRLSLWLLHEDFRSFSGLFTCRHNNFKISNLDV